MQITQKHNKGFTLIEIMLGIIIISIVLVSGFQTLSAVGIAKIKLIEQTEIEKASYFAAERFFELIKTGGSIDYEEYWNRFAQDTSYDFGAYSVNTGFGNLGDLYYCVSGDGDQMGENGCLESYNFPSNNYKNTPQRYGQYALQFIDHNIDADTSADEDGDGKVFGDADDLYLGIGPGAFDSDQDVGELYLINAAGDTRTYFRYKVGTDSFAPNGSSCNSLVAGEKQMTGDACLGTIQFLKLIGRDYGYDHDPNVVSDASDNDGFIDTWLIHPDFSFDGSSPLADINTDQYWQDIFSDDIHVVNAEFYLSPHKDITQSWRDTSSGIRVAPSLQLKMTLQPSWKEKRKIKGTIPQSNIQTTIQLLDIQIQ